jgi:hypothetical protein
MASGLRRGGVPGSALPVKGADRTRRRYTVGAAYAILGALNSSTDS